MTNKIENVLSIVIEAGKEGPPDFLDNEIRKLIGEEVKAIESTKASQSARYTPSDPGHLWRDFQVQNCARRFLKEVVLPDWITNHPHKNCSNIRVDEWGRLLCRYINPTQIGVDGPWENPTHFLMYAYNTFQTQQKYGIRLNTFLRDFCNIAIP